MSSGQALIACAAYVIQQAIYRPVLNRALCLCQYMNISPAKMFDELMVFFLSAGPDTFERAKAAQQLAWLIRRLGSGALSDALTSVLPCVQAAATDPSPAVQAQGLWALHHLARGVIAARCSPVMQRPSKLIRRQLVLQVVLLPGLRIGPSEEGKYEWLCASEQAAGAPCNILMLAVPRGNAQRTSKHRGLLRRRGAAGRPAEP